MTMTCIVCKKIYIPFDESRSFHKFPKDNDLKLKWMNAIGKVSITKSSRICSDHFDAGSYHDTNGYTTLRRLLSNAVPRVMLDDNKDVLVDVINKFPDSNTEISQSAVNNDKSDDAGMYYPSLSIGPLKTEHTPYNDINISHDELIKQEHHQDDSDNSNHLKRESPPKNEASQNEVKSIRFKGNLKTYCFTRQIFCTDKAWAEFQEFATFIKNKMAAAAKNKIRKQKKLDSLKMIIEEHKFTVAEYLQVNI